MARWSVEVVDRNTQSARSVTVRAATAEDARLKVAATDAGIVGPAVLVEIEDSDTVARNVEEGRRVSDRFRSDVFIAGICTAGAEICGLCLFVYAIGISGSVTMSVATDVLTLGFSLMSLIFGSYLLLLCYRQIQCFDREARPFRMVAGTLVPVFGLFWNFVAYCGISRRVQSKHNKRRFANVYVPSQSLLIVWASLNAIMYGAVLAVVSYLMWKEVTQTGGRVSAGTRAFASGFDIGVVLSFVFAGSWIVLRLLYINVVWQTSRFAISLFQAQAGSIRSGAA